MKTLIRLTCLVFLVIVACDSETVLNDELNTVEARGKKLQEKTDEPSIIRQCNVVDADRCPYEDSQVPANFWWPLEENDFFNPTTFFSSTESNELTFTEYDNGTANISGSTRMGDCVVNVDVWLKEKMSFEEWQNLGGEHKKEGCAGNNSVSENMNFYVIDSERSTIEASGTDCISEGLFGVEQRPDPNVAPPNYGAHIGVGGANYDSDLNALGLSTWGWITDLETKERLWIMDFNFKIECTTDEACSTAFGRDANGANCFIDNGFSRWGWSIALEGTGDYTYEIYAAAGQCDIGKGTLVGTVDISYNTNGSVEVTYNINDDFDLIETHTYAGADMFPTKKNGMTTVAPGQYTIADNLEGPIHVIAHAVVCKK